MLILLLCACGRHKEAVKHLSHLWKYPVVFSSILPWFAVIKMFKHFSLYLVAHNISGHDMIHFFRMDKRQFENFLIQFISIFKQFLHPLKIKVSFLSAYPNDMTNTLFFFRAFRLVEYILYIYRKLQVSEHLH